MPKAQAKSYEEACRRFRWRIPDSCNIAVDAIDRQATGSADGHRTALIARSEDGLVARYTFLDLMHYSNRLAQVFAAAGLRAGDEIGLVMSPSGAAAVALLAGLKVGAVVRPLPAGLPNLAECLSAGDITALVGDERSVGLIKEAARQIPGLKLAMAAHASGEGVAELWTSMIGASDTFDAVPTGSADPALALAYGVLSGPVVLAHRALRARAAGVEYVFQNFPQFGDVMWSAGDWAEDGGWIETVLPAWFHGVPVVAASLSALPVTELFSRSGLRCVRLSARQLPSLRTALGNHRAVLRCLVVSGDLSAEDRIWLQDRFGTALIEAFSPVPFGPVMAPSPGLGFTTPPGALGRPAPGTVIDVIDPKGRVLTAGEVGELALLSDSPIMPLSLPQGSLPEPIGRWQPLGKAAQRDLDGIFWPYPPLPPPPPRPERAPLRLDGPDPSERWRR